MNDIRNDVGQFFDTLTTDYTQTIERCFPRYREMIWALLDYLPPARQFESILELGCGTGNLSVLLASAFPQAKLRLVDISQESLEICRSRLPDQSRIEWDQSDFAQLEFKKHSFDLVISNISLHHIPSEQKRQLFSACHKWLRDDGVFSFADQCAGATQDLYDRHMHHWKQLSLEAGSNQDEWNMWMQHQQQHDFHDTLTDQLDWLREANFSVVDCVWRYLLWSVVQARK